MKRIKLFIIAITFLSSNLFAQITVTDNDILSIGDIIYLTEPDSVTSLISPGVAGPNQHWDFSSLQVQNVEILECVDPNGTPHSLYYPNANICIEENNDYIYLNKSSGKVELLGEGDSVFQQPLVVLPLPLTYGSTYTDGPNLILDSIISGPLVNLLLVSQGITAATISGGAAHNADTINLQSEILSDFDVDAWGTITIPMGTFDCLRLKIERTTNTQIQVFCTDTITGTGSGWYLLPFGDLEQEITYQWWSNNVITKFALAEMIVDSVNGIDKSVIFLHNSVSKTKEVTIPLIKIYPVPSTYKLTIEVEGIRANYKMYDISGDIILEDTFTRSTKVSLRNMAKGTYLLNITTEKGSTTKKILVE